jgi:hypothetical protein
VEATAGGGKVTCRCQWRGGRHFAEDCERRLSIRRMLNSSKTSSSPP